eukprot:scaffold2640_cov376-Prasinococcus_capsulatus_cf.AAC.7
MSTIDVPEDCMGFVMGKGGGVLRGVEQEWNTLMFFAKGADGTSEKLAIFGGRRGRRGAELKVMSAIEHKHPNTFIDENNALRRPLKQPGDGVPGDDWDVEFRAMDSSELSYALGAGGSTRRKLANASGCIIEYLGNVAVLYGTSDERGRARDYLGWLLQQKNGPVPVDAEGRTDVDVVSVPREYMGFVTGHKGESLRAVEKETSTFCFTRERDSSSAYEKLLIFGTSPQGRRRAKSMVEGAISRKRERERGPQFDEHRFRPGRDFPPGFAPSMRYGPAGGYRYGPGGYGAPGGFGRDGRGAFGRPYETRDEAYYGRGEYHGYGRDRFGSGRERERDRDFNRCGTLLLTRLSPAFTNSSRCHFVFVGATTTADETIDTTDETWRGIASSLPVASRKKVCRVQTESGTIIEAIGRASDRMPQA